MKGNHWPEQKCVGPMRSELWHTCGHFDDNCIPRLGADISRKVYGFPVTQEPEYRWRDVAEYLRRHLEMVIVYLFREVRAYSLMYGLRNARRARYGMKKICCGLWALVIMRAALLDIRKEITMSLYLK